MARGSFLVSREAARVMEAQGLPADIVYVVSKNAVVGTVRPRCSRPARVMLASAATRAKTSGTGST